MHRMKSVLLLVVAAGGAACSSPPPADEFAAAWKKGEQNEHDGAAGTAYVHQMVRSLGPALTASTQACGGSPAQSTQHVQLAMQLNIDGSVRKAMVAPSSAYWDCVRDALAKKQFPAPPTDGFWTSGTIG